MFHNLKWTYLAQGCSGFLQRLVGAILHGIPCKGRDVLIDRLYGDVLLNAFFSRRVHRNSLSFTNSWSCKLACWPRNKVLSMSASLFTDCSNTVSYLTRSSDKSTKASKVPICGSTLLAVQARGTVQNLTLKSGIFIL